MTAAPRTRLAAYAVSITNDALLLVRISANEIDAGKWTLPGGGLDWGEHPEDGLHRELYEETGLTGSIEGLLGIDSNVLDAERRPGLPALHMLRFVYEVACEGIPQVTEIDGSVDLARWIPLSDVGSLGVIDLVEFALGEASAV